MDSRKNKSISPTKNTTPNLFSQSLPEKKQNTSRPMPIKLQGYPPLLNECFELLQMAGANNFALFGGAIRDADYAARHHQSCVIKDYDIRVWLPVTEFEKHCETLLKGLASIANIDIREEKSLGTDKIRYCLYYQDTELDISIRPVPISLQNNPVPTQAVAINRANDSDIGLCSVAIDPTGQAWARSEYIDDQSNKTLTVYPSNDIERSKAYAERMKKKFPDHDIIWTVENNLLSRSYP